MQCNAVAHVREMWFAPPEWVSRLVVMVLGGLVVLGDIRRIGHVAEPLVPTMCMAYILFALVVLAVNVSELPAAIGLVFTQAFTHTAATGGFAGPAVWAAIRFCVAWGIFSNEVGLSTRIHCPAVPPAAQIAWSPRRLDYVASPFDAMTAAGFVDVKIEELPLKPVPAVCVWGIGGKAAHDAIDNVVSGSKPVLADLAQWRQ